MTNMVDEEVELGELTEGSTCGELAMLGASPYYPVTIRAVTFVYAWRITQEDAHAVLLRFGLERGYLLSLMSSQFEHTSKHRVINHSLFVNFTPLWRTTLATTCESQVIFEGQTIVEEGQMADRLFVINFGGVNVHRKEEYVHSLICGQHFGAAAIMGQSRVWEATFVAKCTTHLIMISRAAFEFACTRYRQAGAVSQLKRKEMLAHKEWACQVESTAKRKLLWRAFHHGAAMDVGWHVKYRDVDLAGVFRAWQHQVSVRNAKRLAKQQLQERYHKMMESWRQKKREADERLGPQRERERAIRQNLEGRGPLVLPEIGRRKHGGDAKTQDAQVAAVLRSFPQLHPSPFYRLRFPSVLRTLKPRSLSSALEILERGGCSSSRNVEPPFTSVQPSQSPEHRVEPWAGRKVSIVPPELPEEEEEMASSPRAPDPAELEEVDDEDDELGDEEEERAALFQAAIGNISTHVVLDEEMVGGSNLSSKFGAQALRKSIFAHGEAVPMDAHRMTSVGRQSVLKRLTLAPTRRMTTRIDTTRFSIAPPVSTREGTQVRFREAEEDSD